MARRNKRTDNTPPRKSPLEHALLIALVSGLFVLGCAWLVDRLQGARETETAKSAVMAGVTNIANEIGSFLELSASRPEQVESLFAAHELKMNELRAPLMAANVVLGGRDKVAKDGFEKMISQLSSIDACITRVYRSVDPTFRQRELVGLGITYRMFTANIADRLPRIAAGGHDDDQFLQLQCPS